MVVQSHVLRPENEEFDYNEVYDGEPTFFSIELHHGGYFTKVPGRSYVKGKVQYIDFVDLDLFSIHDLNDIMEQLGYFEGMKVYYYFLIPECSLDNGLEYIGDNDNDILKLNKYIIVHKCICFYTEHRTIDEANVQPTFPSQSLSLDLLDIINFDPFDSLPYTTTDQNCENIKDGSVPVVDKGKGNSVGENEGSGDTEDGEDSDFLVDYDNHVHDVEVDMSDFNLLTEKDDETLGETLADNEDVLNRDELSSASDSDLPQGRVNYLKKLCKDKKKMAANEGSKYCFYVGQCFGSSCEVKDMVNNHSVETRRELKFAKNDKERVRVVCYGKMPCFSEEESLQNVVKSKADVDPTSKGPNVKNRGGRGMKSNPNKYSCPWVLLVSKLKDSQTWVVKTFVNEHHCLQSRKLRECTSTYLSKQIVDQIEGNPQIPATAIQDQLQKKLELGVSRMKAFRALALAKDQVRGDYIEQYAHLRDYMYELMDKNPCSTVTLEVEEENNPTVQTRVFKRIYVCLGVLKDGFKACGRDILGLDGAFMKGPFPGQVLTAVGVDPNNGIYPVAYAIVEAETRNSWNWFLSKLAEDLGLQANSNFTFISDRQKGIVQAVESVFPCAEHRFCVRHIHENMKLRWKGQTYKNMLWKAATATTVQEFLKAMDDLKKYNQDAHLWLSKIPPKHWSRSHFSGRAQTDVLLNNLCEVFNKQLVHARDKPIIHALEYIREYTMKRIVNVLGVIERSDGPLTPAATKLFEIVKKEASKYTTLWNGGEKYQVSGPWGDQCVVDLKEKACTCRKWELTGIPCKHAVASIWNATLNGQQVGIPEDWVNKVYRIESWKNVYSHKVNPINGQSMWQKTCVPTTLLPPKHHAQVGRPKKKRIRAVDEELPSQKKAKGRRFTIKCKTCGKYGHNQRTCKGQGEGSTGQPSQVEGSRGQPSQGEGSTGQPSQVEGSRGQPSQGEVSTGQPSQVEGSRGQPSQGEGLTGQPSQVEGSRGQPSQGEVSTGQPSQVEGSRGQPSQGEPMLH